MYMPLRLNECMNNERRIHDVDYLNKLQNYFSTMGDYTNHIFMTIDLIGSFERYNNRPYHNYEQWATGYRVSIHPFKNVVKQTMSVDNECIQCACEKLWNELRGLQT